MRLEKISRKLKSKDFLTLLNMRKEIKTHISEYEDVKKDLEGVNNLIENYYRFLRNSFAEFDEADTIMTPYIKEERPHMKHMHDKKDYLKDKLKEIKNQIDLAVKAKNEVKNILKDVVYSLK